MKQTPPDLGHRYYGESDAGWVSTDNLAIALTWQNSHAEPVPLVLDRHTGVWS